MEDVISIKLAAGHMVYLPSNFLIYIFSQNAYYYLSGEKIHCNQTSLSNSIPLV